MVKEVPRALIYMRCSTTEDRQNVDTQADKCIKYCESQGWDYEIIREYSSAWNKERPIFNQQLDRIKNQEFQTLVCFDLDRFSRDDPHIADKYLNLIVHEWNCRFISLNDAIDSDDEIKWHIVRHVMVWMSNKYSERLSNRIKEGIKYKRKTMGVQYHHGRKRKADYKKIKDLFRSGKKISQIARILNINKSSVWNAVRSENKNT